MARRKVTRIRGNRGQGNRMEGLIREYKVLKNRLTSMINKEKDRCWKEIFEKVNEDVWGQGYRITVNSLKIRQPRVVMEEEELMSTVKELFPEDTDGGRRGQLPVNTGCKRTDIKEVRRAVGRLKEGKAPGSDGIPVEVVKELVTQRPEYVVALYKRWLQEGSFPKIWKKAKLVLIPKPGRERNRAGAYRPICLLDVLRKGFEGVLVDRIKRELERTGGLSDQQYCFRERRSTLGALEEVADFAKREGRMRLCALILVDVKNAFNSASWWKILIAMQRRNIDSHLLRMIESYL